MTFSRIRRIFNFGYYYNSYANKITHFEHGFNKIDEFNIVNYLTVTRDYVHYATRTFETRRVIIVLITRIAILINMLRFYLSIILRGSPSKIYLMDIGKLLGHPILFSSAIGTVSLAILAIGLTLSYQEITHTVFAFDVFDEIRHGRIRYPLKPNNFRKYCIKVNLVTDFVFKECHLFMVLFCVLLNFGLSLILLINHEFNFYLLASFIFFNVIMVIFSIQCFGYVWLGFIIWFMSTLYLKYKFIEINEKIELSLKHSNINLLMYSMKEHNYVEIMTKKFNHFFRKITFIIYFIATIGFQIMFYGIHHKGSTPYGRVGFAFTLFNR